MRALFFRMHVLFTCMLIGRPSVGFETARANLCHYSNCIELGLELLLKRYELICVEAHAYVYRRLHVGGLPTSRET